ncbi:hypothetical protein [Thermococcus litoralis]|nr:hypothetical protein [Thermococcus litoralis]
MEISGNDGAFIKAQNIVTLAKPPWVEREHNGKLERLILQLGSGKGSFRD